MKKYINKIFTNKKDLLFIALFTFFIVFGESIFFNSVGDLSLLKSLIESFSKIFFVFFLAFIWSGSVFQILSMIKQTSDFVDKNWDTVFRLTFAISFILHLAFALNTEQFSLFLSIISLPLFSTLSKIVKDHLQSSRTVKQGSEDNSDA